jgi:hypothetical protein
MYLPTGELPLAGYIQLGDPHNPEETIHKLHEHHWVLHQ